jgi:hypothetical protein
MITELRNRIEDLYIKEKGKFAYLDENKLSDEYIEWLEDKVDVEYKLYIDLVSKRNWFEKLPLHWKLLLHTSVGVLLGLTIAYVC